MLSDPNEPPVRVYDPSGPYTETDSGIDLNAGLPGVREPWIARRDHLSAFLIRRDPRDISRIWVLEPEGQHYLEIPYRTLSHPAVTLWEQRQALAKLRQQGREQVDESALFRMIGQMREIVTTAQKATRKARRDADRRQHLKTSEPPAKPIPPDVDMADPQADNLPPAKPFDQIEEW